MADTNIICVAIRKRLVLEFRYRGLHRVVEPYCHGFSTRNVEVLRAVQVGGRSRSDGFGFGKLWALSDITDPRLTAQTFDPDDPNYNPDDRVMKSIHCRIERPLQSD